MNKLTLFIAIVCALISTNASATPVAAGNIRIEWIFANDYDVYAEYYTNCLAAPPPDTLTLCAQDLLNPSNSFTVTMYRDSMANWLHDDSSGDTVALGWGPDSTQCYDPASTIPGYRRWSYYNTITLPAASTWRISAYADTLDASDNITASPFYIENIVDNKTSFYAEANGSVFMSQPKVIYVQPAVPCTLTLNAINLGLTADSFLVEIDTVLTSTGACTAPTIASFSTASPAYSIPLNPFQTGNSLTLSQTVPRYSNGTATLNFTPIQSGNYLLGIKTTAYRITGNGGVWIPLNITRHWIRMHVLGSTMPQTCDTFTGGSIGCLSNCVATADTVIALVSGVHIGFCYKAQSADTGVKYVVTDDHGTSLPAASITYIGQNTDTVTASFSWLPTALSDTGWHAVIFDIVDTACAMPVHYQDTVHLYTHLTTMNVGIIPDNQLFNLYPNPTKGSFTLTSNMDTPVNLEIINNIGQVVYATTYSKLINLPDYLPDGTYILKVYGSTTPVTIPFILSR